MLFESDAEGIRVRTIRTSSPFAKYVALEIRVWFPDGGGLGAGWARCVADDNCFASRRQAKAPAPPFGWAQMWRIGRHKRTS